MISVTCIGGWIQVETASGKTFGHIPRSGTGIYIHQNSVLKLAGILMPFAAACILREHRSLFTLDYGRTFVNSCPFVSRSGYKYLVAGSVSRHVIGKCSSFGIGQNGEVSSVFPHDHIRVHDLILDRRDLVNGYVFGDVFAVKPVETYPIGRNVFSGNVLRVESFHNGNFLAQAGYAVGYLVSVFIRQFDRDVFARQIHRGRRCRRIYQRCVFGDVDRYFDGRFVDLGRSEVDQDLSGRLIDFSVDRRAVVGCLERFYERIDYGGYLIRNREIVHNDVDRGGILQIQRFAYGAALVIYRCAFDQREGYRNGLYIHRSGIIQFDGCIFFVEAYFGDIVRFDF